MRRRKKKKLKNEHSFIFLFDKVSTVFINSCAYKILHMFDKKRKKRTRKEIVLYFFRCVFFPSESKRSNESKTNVWQMIVGRKMKDRLFSKEKHYICVIKV
jgi:hypothetical protein